MSRTDLDATTLANSLRMRAGDGSMEWVYEPIQASVLLDIADMLDENAKLRELCADMLWTIKHAHGWYKNDTHEMLMTDVRGRDGEPTNVSHSLTTDEEMYEKRMRELGVEVDG